MGEEAGVAFGVGQSFGRHHFVAARLDFDPRELAAFVLGADDGRFGGELVQDFLGDGRVLVLVGVAFAVLFTELGGDEVGGGVDVAEGFLLCLPCGADAPPSDVDCAAGFVIACGPEFVVVLFLLDQDFFRFVLVVPVGGHRWFS